MARPQSVEVERRARKRARWRQNRAAREAERVGTESSVEIAPRVQLVVSVTADRIVLTSGIEQAAEMAKLGGVVRIVPRIGQQEIREAGMAAAEVIVPRDVPSKRIARAQPRRARVRRLGVMTYRSARETPTPSEEELARTVARWSA